jgi:hypothetical protein
MYDSQPPRDPEPKIVVLRLQVSLEHVSCCLIVACVRDITYFSEKVPIAKGVSEKLV